MTPLIIASAMRQQAESRQPAYRQLTGGLMLKFSRSGEKRILTIARKHPGPGVDEREQWRKAFGVPALAFELKSSEGEYVVVSVEWMEK